MLQLTRGREEQSRELEEQQELLLQEKSSSQAILEEKQAKIQLAIIEVS